ncbi:hypothetical protein DFH09DRAFT_1316588 [Mycena vulgaris]|nr:hypothetical protein DFH09DRAFT_1338831 [Mycena vulgaris]KAJ6528682.1 hypothetical protein DFH09DRAFT_1327692 [Mycena vulgaris]KAJ6560570.1 hypothetical protein DFH09DRAFT_1316588 [Mycena vulgaris]
MSSQFYCDPPFHPDPGYKKETAGTVVWLAVDPRTRFPGPGNYTSWESCKRASSGISGCGGIRYASVAESLPAWHARCALGEHFHPADPDFHAAPPYSDDSPPLITDTSTTSIPILLSPRTPRATPSSPRSPTSRRGVMSHPNLLVGHTLRFGGGVDTSRLDSALEQAVAEPAEDQLELARATTPPTSPGRLSSPPSSPSFFSTRGGHTVHHKYGPAHAQLVRIHERDPSATLFATTEHVLAAFVAAGYSPAEAEGLAAMERAEAAEAAREGVADVEREGVADVERGDAAHPEVAADGEGGDGLAQRIAARFNMTPSQLAAGYVDWVSDGQGRRGPDLTEQARRQGLSHLLRHSHSNPDEIPATPDPHDLWGHYEDDEEFNDLVNETQGGSGGNGGSIRNP